MSNSYTVKQVAELLNTNPETVRRWIRDGKLIADKNSNKGGNIILESSLKAFVKAVPKYSTVLAANLPLTIVGAAALATGGIALGKIEENEKIDNSKIDLASIKVLLESQILTQKSEIKKKKKTIEKLNSEISNAEKILNKLNKLLSDLEKSEGF